MNHEEFTKLKAQERRGPVVTAGHFIQVPRTLLLGWTIDRKSWHVYLQDRRIHRVLYTAAGEVLDHTEGTDWDSGLLIPSKRVYPESMDKHLALLLWNQGVDVPYTTFSADRYEDVKNEKFHGFVVG